MCRAALGLIWMLGVCFPLIGAERPNIVFILTDDLRYDMPGYAGHPVVKTPNIDRLAREGMDFRNFFCSTPLCSPSRASFLTGQYAHTHRIINNDKQGLDAISHTLQTWPRTLRRAGYETAFIGKWHMGLDDSRRPGFDHWISFKGQGSYLDGVVNLNGQQIQTDGYMTDHLNQWAVEWLNQKHEKPFVLYLAHKAVHFPYLPADRHENLYKGEAYVPPPSAQDDLAGKTAMTRKLNEKVDVLRMEGATPEPQEPRYGRQNDPSSVLRDQWRCLAAVDEGVGRILDALTNAGKLDDTIIIFTGDNGYLMGEHKQFDQKRWPYEESIRIPFVIRYPRLIKRGSICDAMVMNIDVAPTLLELGGAQSPVKMHGRSFVPLLKNPADEWRKQMLTEYFVEKIGLRVPDWQSVRTEKWKLVHYPELSDADELYDLAADSHEMKNVIRLPENASAVEELRGKLQNLLDETGAKR